MDMSNMRLNSQECLSLITDHCRSPYSARTLKAGMLQDDFEAFFGHKREFGLQEFSEFGEILGIAHLHGVGARFFCCSG
jgi:hypothetical protein